MNASTNGCNYWRERAEEARAQAEQMRDPDDRRTLLEIAASCWSAHDRSFMPTSSPADMGSLAEDHLADSKRHLSAAEARISQQRDLLRHLRSMALDTTQAETLLKNFEEIAATMRAHDIILRQHG